MRRIVRSGWVLGGRCLDDRGRAVRIVRVYGLPQYWARARALPRSVQTAVERDLARDNSLSWRLAPIALLCAACAIAIGRLATWLMPLIASVTRPPNPIWPSAVAVLTIPLSLAPAIIAAMNGVASPFIAGAALKSACCASCGHPLAGCVPALDGCIVCPECGAAWSGERLLLEPRPRRAEGR